MIAVLKHELSNYFHSLISYIFCAALLIFVGIGTMMYCFESGIANFEYVLSFICIVMVIIIPVLTMRVIAEEKKQKTDQLLFSLPLSTTDIVMGKFLAVLIVYLIPMVIVALYPLILSRFGDVPLQTAYGTLVAFVFMSAAMIAIGIYISSLTENQGFAAGISIAVLLFNYYSVTLAEYVSATAMGSFIVLVVIAVLIAILIRFLTKNESLAFWIGFVMIAAMTIVYFFKSTLFEGLVADIMSQLSLFDRFTSFVGGSFELTAIVFYITVIIFFLFLTVQSLEKRRYN